MMMIGISVVTGRYPGRSRADLLRYALIGLIGGTLPQLTLFWIAENVPAMVISIVLSVESFIVFVVAAVIGLEAPNLKRFIGLQTYGQAEARSLARHIQARLDECPPPEHSALRGGLALLGDTDLRLFLASYARPALAILGGHDRLVPKAVMPPLRVLNPRMEIHELPSAAHLPFLTHPDATATLILAFLARQEPLLAG
jgi:pimeloyl-ACP methyl ester carboxylesterase